MMCGKLYKPGTKGKHFCDLSIPRMLLARGARHILVTGSIAGMREGVRRCWPFCQAWVVVGPRVVQLPHFPEAQSRKPRTRSRKLKPLDSASLLPPACSRQTGDVCVAGVGTPYLLLSEVSIFCGPRRSASSGRKDTRSR